jgi:hypothetical protein
MEAYPEMQQYHWEGGDIKKLNICFLSTYHTGSHKAHIIGYLKYTKHNIVLFSLEGNYWKHRMNLGALSLAEKYITFMKQKSHQFYFDLIIATDMVDLSSFVAKCRRYIDPRKTCIALYMHENQLTYPIPSDRSNGVYRRNNGQLELQFALLNYKSQMISDYILFNSHFHYKEWFDKLPKFLNQNRDEKLLHTVEDLRIKSSVLYVGIELHPANKYGYLNNAPSTDQNGSMEKTPPLIIWNQRWEYDKAPEKFVKVLSTIASSKRARFRVAICGEQFHLSESTKQKFENEIAPLKEFIVHCGYASPEQYHSLLEEALCTISTAEHEFFGISIVEAIFHCCFPILPNRLSYPELLPKHLHEQFLYDTESQLINKLEWVFNNEEEARRQAIELANSMKVEQFDWKSNMAAQYDQYFVDLCSNFQLNTNN